MSGTDGANKHTASHALTSRGNPSATRPGAPDAGALTHGPDHEEPRVSHPSCHNNSASRPHPLPRQPVRMFPRVCVFLVYVAPLDRSTVAERSAMKSSLCPARPDHQPKDDVRAGWGVASMGRNGRVESVGRHGPGSSRGPCAIVPGGGHATPCKTVSLPMSMLILRNSTGSPMGRAIPTPFHRPVVGGPQKLVWCSGRGWTMFFRMAVRSGRVGSYFRHPRPPGRWAGAASPGFR